MAQSKFYKLPNLASWAIGKKNLGEVTADYSNKPIIHRNSPLLQGIYEIIFNGYHQIIIKAAILCVWRSSFYSIDNNFNENTQLLAHLWYKPQQNETRQYRP